MPARKYPQEPNRNDPCLCGSGRKFKKCCGPLYRDLPRGSVWRVAFRDGDYERALAELRPEMCRYAIWHLSHTVPWYKDDPDAAEQLLAINILALAARGRRRVLTEQGVRRTGARGDSVDCERRL